MAIQVFILLLLWFLNFFFSIFPLSFLFFLLFWTNSPTCLIIAEASFPHQHIFPLWHNASWILSSAVLQFSCNDPVLLSVPLQTLHQYRYLIINPMSKNADFIIFILSSNDTCSSHRVFYRFFFDPTTLIFSHRPHRSYFILKISNEKANFSSMDLRWIAISNLFYPYDYSTLNGTLGHFRN